MNAQRFPEKSIVLAVAVCGIPKDRVKDMFEVAAYLVLTPGYRSEFHEGVAGGRIASNGIRQGAFGQGFEESDR